MFMQQLPKPAPGPWVAVDEWERMRTSAPLKTPALYMAVFAAGDARYSAGEPYTVTGPGVFVLVGDTFMGTAGARTPGASVLCLVPRQAMLGPRRSTDLTK